MNRRHRVIIYARISKDGEGLQLGVDRQVKECKALVEAKGWELVGVFVDNNISAFSRKRRPGFDAAVAAFGSAEAIVTYAPDRLTRHPRELEDLIDALEAAGVDVHTVIGGQYDLSTPPGRMAARVVGAVARLESEIKSARLKSKHRELAEAGKPSGCRPFGYDAGGAALNTSEAAIIRELVDRILSGDTLSLSAIARDLNARGIPTTRGRAWSNTTLRQILGNPRIAGLRTTTSLDPKTGRRRSRVVTGEATWPAIITVAEHRRMVAILDDPARAQRRGKEPRLLTGLLVCGLCGVRLVASSRKGQPIYTCDRQHPADRQGCRKLSILAEPVEQIVTAALIRYAADVERVADDDTEAVAATTELAAIEADRIRLGQMLVAADPAERLDPVTVLAAQRGLDGRQAAAEARLRVADRRTRHTALAGVQGGLAETWEAHPERRRTIAAELIDSIEIAPWDPHARGFDPGRIGKPRWRKLSTPSLV